MRSPRSSESGPFSSFLSNSLASSVQQEFKLEKLEQLQLLNHCPRTPLELFQVTRVCNCSCGPMGEVLYSAATTLHSAGSVLAP